MQCDVCGAEVGPEQKFCMECGARLHGATSTDDQTAVPRLELAPPGGHPMFDPVTGQLLALPPPPRASDPDATAVLPAVDHSSSAVPAAASLVPPPFAPPDPTPAPGVAWAVSDDRIPVWPGETMDQRTRVQYGDTSARFSPAGPAPTRQLPANYVPHATEPWDGGAATEWENDEWGASRPPTRPAFRVKPLLILTILAVAASVVAMFTTVITIGPTGPEGLIGQWKLNDFGTNLTITGVVAAVFMVLGSLAWCGGYRWGAGLAGGAGASIAGWAVLSIGQAELPIQQGRAAGFTRDIGYWSLVAAGGLALVVLVVSLARAGGEHRAGLDPWVAALGAMAAIVAAVGPLIPIGGADISANYTSAAGTDLPTLFFVARFAQLGLLLLCGVFGFLLVRRYGLGLAIGGSVAAGWMVLTTATEQTDFPIGLAKTNPGSSAYDMIVDANITVGQPPAVTMVGVALLFFFALVATAMALIDSDR